MPTRDAARLVAIAICCAFGLALFLGSIFTCTPFAADAVSQGQAASCSEFWVNRYQTLIGAGITLAAAGLAFFAVTRQTAAARAPEYSEAIVALRRIRNLLLELRRPFDLCFQEHFDDIVGMHATQSKTLQWLAEWQSSFQDADKKTKNILNQFSDVRYSRALGEEVNAFRDASQESLIYGWALRSQLLGRVSRDPVQLGAIANETANRRLQISTKIHLRLRDLERVIDRELANVERAREQVAPWPDL